VRKQTQKHDYCYDDRGYFDCACDHELLECFAGVHVPAGAERTRAFRNVAAMYFSNTLCRTGRNEWLWGGNAEPAKLRALKNVTGKAAAVAGAVGAPLAPHSVNVTLLPHVRAATRLVQAAAAAFRNATAAVHAAMPGQP
jgi:hypothetical protein